MRKSNPTIFYLFLLLVISAISYLPFIRQIGFMNDDWYLVYDSYTRGADFFHTVFSIDRPARAFLQIFIHSLFKENILYYHLSAYLIRFLSGLSLFWLLNRVSKSEKFLNFLIALFFLIYPGFLMQVNPVDYHAHLVALLFGLLSVLLSVQFAYEKKVYKKLLLYISAVLSGWFSLGLMEWYIGLEYYRLLFILWATVSLYPHNHWKETVKASILSLLPFLVIPVGFLLWRVFLFDGTRSATDISMQVGKIFNDPMYVGLWWGVRYLKSFINTLLGAWIVPFYDLVSKLRLRDALVVLGIGFISSAGFLITITRRGFKSLRETAISDSPSLQWMVMGGLGGVIMGLLPVIVTNREVNFTDFSRYTLVASIGAVMVIVSLISKLSSAAYRNGVLVLLAFIAVCTHNANASLKAVETQYFRQFWWQVSWRVPDIEPGTLLAIQMPYTSIFEDYITWGPANLIYYPEKQTEEQTIIPVAGIVLTPENIQKIILGKGSVLVERRGNLSEQNFERVLVISQPSVNSCVHVYDNHSLVFSAEETPTFMVIAERSQINLVNPYATPHNPPKEFFGFPPPENWCFYYQRAELARQKQDWSEILALMDDALERGYTPVDRIEWMPFLQALVVLDKQDELLKFAPIMKEIPFVGAQTCNFLIETAQTYRSDHTELINLINSSFCE